MIVNNVFNSALQIVLFLAPVIVLLSHVVAPAPLALILDPLLLGPVERVPTQLEDDHQAAGLLAQLLGDGVGTLVRRERRHRPVLGRQVRSGPGPGRGRRPCPRPLGSVR